MVERSRGRRLTVTTPRGAQSRAIESSGCRRTGSRQLLDDVSASGSDRTSRSSLLTTYVLMTRRAVRAQKAGSVAG